MNKIPTIATISALLVLLLFLAIGVTGCIEDQKKALDEIRRPVPITTEALRDRWVDKKIDTLKNNQTFGDAEVGLTGGNDLYLTLVEQSKSMFPEANYYRIFSGRDAPPEFTRVWLYYYTKDESAEIQK